MKFKANDRVFYPYLNLTGTVLKVINQNDPDDVDAQGYRYEVSFKYGQEVWSVLESELKDK